MMNMNYSPESIMSATLERSSTDDDMPSLISMANSTSQTVPSPMPNLPLLLTCLSLSSWRKPYPVMGHFAGTKDEEIIAASPSGLIYFKRILDHPMKPWTEPRPLLSDPPMMLSSATVSGLALYSGQQSQKPFYQVYCVAGGVLHRLYRSDQDGGPFLVDSEPPLSGHRVNGVPGVEEYIAWDNKLSLSLVVPCESGGFLHTSTWLHTSSSIPPLLHLYGDSSSLLPREARYSEYSYALRDFAPSYRWEQAEHLSEDFGIISGMSVVMISRPRYPGRRRVTLLAACIAGGQLFTVEKPIDGPESSMSSQRRQTRTSRISHPDEVGGNPSLISGDNFADKLQLDMLVSSTTGGIFHYVRTPSSSDEWHMVGRFQFPPDVPAASCLSFARQLEYGGLSCLRALIQSGGRLYRVKTAEGATAWEGCQLTPITGPGPSHQTPTTGPGSNPSYETSFNGAGAGAEAGGPETYRSIPYYGSTMPPAYAAYAAYQSSDPIRAEQGRKERRGGTR
ncbi:hypothetical protein F4778DRAFT_432194 [Xylariomycetidae sp. FL2044]|nr:hypothetical protein F4778DRAFT_432194 [Xylariomycetidae sp. FL2044]